MLDLTFELFSEVLKFIATTATSKVTMMLARIVQAIRLRLQPEDMGVFPQGAE